jgi:hypothetical protein
MHFFQYTYFYVYRKIFKKFNRNAPGIRQFLMPRIRPNTKFEMLFLFKQQNGNKIKNIYRYTSGFLICLTFH